MAGFIDRRFEEVACIATEIDSRILPIDLRKLADVAFMLCVDPTKEKVEVGSSAAEMTKFWPRGTGLTKQTMATILPSRSRTNRILEASPLSPSQTGRYFVDDVAVSGLTIQTARAAAGQNSGDEAVVGMAWQSRRLRRRIAVPLQAAILYSQAGGGVPAINSVSTLVGNDELMTDYAQRKSLNIDALKKIAKLYKEK